MAKSQNSFIKQENEKKRLKRNKEKQQRKEERKLNPSSGGFENMIAYVDENGNLTNTPPDPAKKKKIDASTIEIGVSRREEQEVPAVRNGRVDFYDDSKGFGFIKETGTQEKYFVHVNGLLDSIKEGDTVSFELEQGRRGINAVHVKKA
ncbi:MAG: cold shock domain-containing protein [Bacteroidales bacterium]|nr:cold shock domain-containing protein [Bacteroidales bacterium]